MLSLLRTLLHDIGILLHVPGVLAVPCLLVAAIAGEESLLLPFGATVGLSVGIGQICYRARHGDVEGIPGSIRLGSLAVSWLLAAAIAAIPFAWAAYAAVTDETVRAYGAPLSAFFEAVSGLTGTGLTMSGNPAELPHALQIWRSSLEWAGGIGMVLLAAFILRPTVALKPLYENEIHIGTPAEADTHRVAGRLLFIYASLTLASILAFFAAGMPAWEALNHGITALSTGGFAVTPDSFQSYGATIKVVGSAIILLGATSFAVHYRLLFNRDVRVLRSQQLRLFIVLVAIGTALVAAISRVFTGELALADALFSTMSALATCGLNSVEISGWHPTIPPLLLAAMVLGAQLGSTGGGIKLERVVQVFLGIARGFRRSRSVDAPDLDESERLDMLRTEHSDLKRFWQAAIVVILYLTTLGLGTFGLLLAVGGAEPFFDVFFEAASALGNVGLSSGLSSPDLAPAGRVVLIVLMWAGRLELLALVILLLLPVAPADRLAIPETPAPPLMPHEEDE